MVDASKNNNISEVAINVELREINNFKSFKTQSFYVNGNEWLIKFSKLTDEEASTLGVYLKSNVEYNSNELLIVATWDVMLTSKKSNKKPHVQTSYLDAFSISNSLWGTDTFISWNEMVDPINGYVNDDSCKFKIKVKATPLLNAGANDWLKFETLSSCQECTLQKYRMTIYDFQNVIGVCSPKIDFNKSSWRIAVGEREGKIVTTICKTDENNSCRLSTELKLLSFDENVQPINVGIENQEFASDGAYRNLNLVTWEELNDPTKNFIQNDVFVIEIGFKAELDTTTSKRRRSYSNEDSIGDCDGIVLVCSECGANLNRCLIFTFSCGHMFCDECSQKVKECPICGMPTSSTDLRPVRTR